jgi:hypothetical protein
MLDLRDSLAHDSMKAQVRALLLASKWETAGKD